jgi:hypothetical protein
MRRLLRFAVILPWLAAALLMAGCSDGDAPSDAETASPPASEAAGPELVPARTQTKGSGFDPVRAYDAECPAGEEEPSIECEWLRGLVVADVVEALEAIGDSRDQRGVEEALAALDLDDEPEVLIAACRVLGRFPDTPGIAEKLTPLLLDSPYLEVRRVAAQVLSRNPESNLAAMADQWSRNHNGLYSEDPYDELPGIPAQYAGMGFPDYPGAEWFTPADSDRSVGWWSADPPSVVAARLGEMLGVEAMNYQQWIERSQQQMMAAFQSIDQTKVAEVQKLTEEFIKTQDQKLLERITSLQQEIYAPLQHLGDAEEMTVAQVATPPGSAEPDQVHYLIAQEKAGHVSRLILIYRQKVPERTVIQMAWDLRDNPPAWPVE